MMDLCLQNSFKMNIVNIYTLYWGDKAAGKQIFQLFASTFPVLLCQNQSLYHFKLFKQLKSSHL